MQQLVKKLPGLLEKHQVRVDFATADSILPNRYEIYGPHSNRLLLITTSPSCRSQLLTSENYLNVLAELYNVSRIALKRKVESNDFRTPLVEWLWPRRIGSMNDLHNVEVETTENGIVYGFDLTKSMFSKGNISEKLRISSFDCRAEVVVDLFAGIGYFVLPYLVHAGAVHVHCCEWNPASVSSRQGLYLSVFCFVQSEKRPLFRANSSYLQPWVVALEKNLRRNKVAPERYSIHLGDCRQVAPQNCAQRVNLGLLPDAVVGYRPACLALSETTGGWLLPRWMCPGLYSWPTCINPVIFRKQNTFDTFSGWLHVHQNCSYADNWQDGPCLCVEKAASKLSQCPRCCSLVGNKLSNRTLARLNWAKSIRQSLQLLFDELRASHRWTVSCSAVFKVKNFAPKIDHVVFDFRCDFNG